MLDSDDRDNTLSSFSASFATDIVELVVYTTDDAFLQTLKSSAGDARRLWHVPSADKVADLLVAGQVGILVLDVQALGSDSNLFIIHLKHQFPDLVLVVAGSRDAEIELAGLISNGAVYRFIHKPMSAARARLFVDAAVKKYLDRRDRVFPAAALPRGDHRRRLWAGAAIVLLATGLLASWALLRRDPDSPLPRTAIVATPAAAESTLTARAAAALATNRLTSPSGDNALELYRQALAHDPTDAAAQAGLTDVRERLWALADNALLEERLDAAATAIETARQAGVDGGRIALLTAQLAALRERPKGQPAETHPQGEPAQRVAETGTLTRFVNLTQARIKEGRLLEPDGDSARFYLQEALRLDPKVSSVVSARQSLAAALLADARAAIDRHDFAHAANTLDAAAGIAGAASIASAREQLRAALQRAEADRRDQMLRTAQERLRQDRLIEPPNDSAKYYLLTLRNANSGYPGLGSALQDLGQRLVANARRALELKQFDAAHNWLDEAAAVGFSSPDSLAVTRDLEAAAGRQTSGARIAASELTLLKSVKAVYPVGAQREKTEGWVELDFTVGEGGDVKDVAVHASEPARIFDNAAMRALSQWRYQPVLKDGTPIEQRSRVRIRFALAD